MNFLRKKNGEQFRKEYDPDEREGTNLAHLFLGEANVLRVRFVTNL